MPMPAPSATMPMPGFVNSSILVKVPNIKTLNSRLASSLLEYSHLIAVSLHCGDPNVMDVRAFHEKRVVLRTAS